MKTLVIAEKPSVANDIAKVLGCTKKNNGFISGDKYIISWAVGHLIALKEPNQIDEKYKKWKMEDLPIIPDKIPLKTISSTFTQYKVLKNLMLSSEVENIICATDAGREGELIFRLIYEYSKCKLPCKRLWISSLTDESIKDGFEKLKDIDEYNSLYHSAICRAYADWYVGMNTSRLYSLIYNAHLSIGRVQTPTLALIVNRQLEIDNFVPIQYWKVQAKFNGYDGIWFDIKNSNQKENTHIKSLHLAEDISKRCNGQNTTVYKITNEEKTELPPLLYDLTSLQRSANEIYGYTADKTLKLAQELYEKYKLITYPRTDSRYLSTDMEKHVPKLLKNLSNIYPKESENAIASLNNIKNKNRIFNNNKITDHHAIIPTGKTINMSILSKDLMNIYNIIVVRFIQVFYNSYTYKLQKIILKMDNDYFLSQGKTTCVLGWKELENHIKKQKISLDDKTLPNLKIGDIQKIISININDDYSKPPEQYTDSTLLSAMENVGKSIEEKELRDALKGSGLGTPATRAAIIERLIKVGYIKRIKRKFIPLEKGINLINIVPESLSSPKLTSQWELKLQDIKNSDKSRKLSAVFLTDIKEYTKNIIENSSDKKKDIVFEQNFSKKANKNLKISSCPICKNGSILENSKSFYCSNWKSGCKYNIWKDSIVNKGGPLLTKELFKKVLENKRLQGSTGTIIYDDNKIDFIKK